MPITSIQHRRGTTAQWDAANTILAAGELGLDLTLRRVKIGDGSTPWSTLPYVGGLVTTNAGAALEVLRKNAANTELEWAAPSGGVGGLHAATHSAGATDPVTLAQSQITGLASDLTNRVLTSDTRLSDQRTPLDNSVTTTKVAVANRDGTPATASMRTLGTGSQQAAAGNDTRLSDQRTPTDASVTIAKVSTGNVGAALDVLRKNAANTGLEWAAPAAGTGGGGTALSTTYTPATSTLAATNVQDAIDELDDDIIASKAQAVIEARAGMATAYRAVNAQSAAYTIAIADVGKVVEMTNAAAVALTVPTNATTAFDIGSEVDLYNNGAGLMTVTEAAGVTINRAAGKGLKLAQFASAKLRKRATNEWVLHGENTV